MRTRIAARKAARQRLHERLKGSFRVVVDTAQLKTILQATNISYRELARRTGGEVTHVTVLNMAKGRHSPTMRSVRAVTEVLLRELNRGYGDELTKRELVDLITEGLGGKAKANLWDKLTNRVR